MYNIFISHSWNDSDSYEKLINLLKIAPYFTYKNYSVPHNQPLVIYNKEYYDSELKNKIRNQMKTCHVILILAGVYGTYSKSIQMEISIAKELKKPIIAIELFGSERTSLIVKNNANRMVKWNTNSLITAIKECAL